MTDERDQIIRALTDQVERLRDSLLEADLTLRRIVVATSRSTDEKLVAIREVASVSLAARNPPEVPLYLRGREVDGLSGEALREETTCTCGAGHGSGEAHTDWCSYQPALSPTEPEAEK